MNIRELFDVEAAIPFDVEDHTVTFFFRPATTEEEMEFRKRVSRQRIKENGTLESSETALKAPLYLFGKLCKKITVANGDGQAELVSVDDQKFIPDQLKLDALAAFRGRIKRRDDDQLNS